MKNDLIDMGFIELPNSKILGTLLYKLPRNRSISISNLNTPNEMMYLCQNKGNEITDLVCIHNWDYDKYISLDKIKQLIEWFKK